MEDITLTWIKNLRDDNYKQIILWNDALINVNDIKEIDLFNKFINNEKILKHPIKIIGNVQQEDSNSIDLFFLIHNEDILDFTHFIAKYEMQWYDGTKFKYPLEFTTFYPKIGKN
jgi:hypothetical protein